MIIIFLYLENQVEITHQVDQDPDQDLDLQVHILLLDNNHKLHLKFFHSDFILIKRKSSLI